MSGCRFQATLVYMETVDRGISVIWVYHCWFIFYRLAGILSLCLFPWPTYWRSITRMRNMWVLWTVAWHCVCVCTIKHSSVDTTISFYCLWVAVHKCAICGTRLSHCIHPKKATGELIACASRYLFQAVLFLQTVEFTSKYSEYLCEEIASFCAYNFIQLVLVSSCSLTPVPTSIYW